MGKVRSVVRAGNPERLAKAAGTTAQQSLIVYRAVLLHGFDARRRFQRTDQHRLTLLNTLTEAHLSLLPLLAEGMTDDELAKSRGATLPTTKLLVRQLLARLQCRNRTEAAIFAWRHTGTLAQLCSSPEASKPRPPDFLKSDGASNAV